MDQQFSTDSRFLPISGARLLADSKEVRTRGNTVFLRERVDRLHFGGAKKAEIASLPEPDKMLHLTVVAQAKLDSLQSIYFL